MKKYFSLLLLLTITLIGNAQSDTSESEPTAKTQRAVEPKVKVFPNPATNVVNVLGLRNTEKADIIISDIYGNTVSSHQWAIRRNALNIPIATLRPGAYIIRVHSDEQQVRTKFYKQ
ncbi:T9SS type A sorting domain-containing protein [Pricia sp.]|uniref:T9SS type A sorting domain-containing protein n=1 Tax=Pricia sp. TaxID=2268138 RepID=UPI00359373FF